MNLQSFHEHRAHFSSVDVERFARESVGVQLGSTLVVVLLFESLFLWTAVVSDSVVVDVDGVEVDVVAVEVGVDVVGVDVDVVEVLVRAVEVGFLAFVSALHAVSVPAHDVGVEFAALPVLFRAVEADFVALAVLFRNVEVDGRSVCHVNVNFHAGMMNVDVSRFAEHFRSISRVSVGGFEVVNEVDFCEGGGSG